MKKQTYEFTYGLAVGSKPTPARVVMGPDPLTKNQRARQDILDKLGSSLITFPLYMALKPIIKPRRINAQP